ncbi:MAG: class I SAM-dependent methyltransferase [Candidatus Aminicenantes bacterium]|nr:class I SAM-dependent methyltransferase [Candidatus Aminicenantes bacterium]
MISLRSALPSHRIGITLVFLALCGAMSSCQADKAPPASNGMKYTAEEMDRISQTLFKPIYVHLAQQIQRDYQIKSGVCIEAGSGSASWAIEIAKSSDLKVTAVDIDPAAVKLARKNIRRAGVSAKVEALEADVAKMPFPDDYADIVVSRGSYMFWKDKVKAFAEIRRVLKPGGLAYIGGGLGNMLPPADREHIRDVMAKENIGPPPELEVGFEEMGKILRAAGINLFRLATDESCLCGLWVEFRKPTKSIDSGRGDKIAASTDAVRKDTEGL